MTNWDRIQRQATAWFAQPEAETPEHLAPVQNAARFGRRGGTGDLPIGSVVTCPACGETREVREAGSGKYVIRYWSDCQCVIAAIAEAEAARALAAERQARIGREQLVARLGLARVTNFRMETFDPALLHSEHPDSHPHTYAQQWLDGVRGESCGSYHRGPPVALYFYSRGKGRGKTHLAAALAWSAYDWGYLAAFVEETSYLSGYWAADFETRDEMQTLLGDRAWLTVIDDLGQNPPGGKGTGASKAWYDITNRRWQKCGWTIITSNRTLDELVEQGTINDATYSRLYQMTRGQMVYFDGADYRLEGVR